MTDYLKNKALALFKRQTSEYNEMKAIEELQELSTVLTQSITRGKPDKYREKIQDEIADVKVRLIFLEKTYGEKEITKKVKLKILKLYNKHVSNR